MAGRLDEDTPSRSRSRLAVGVAVAAGVSMVGIGLVLFLAGRPGSTPASGGAPTPSTTSAATRVDGPRVERPPSAEPVASAIDLDEPPTSPSATDTASPTPRGRPVPSPRPRPSTTASVDASPAADDGAPGSLQVIVVPWGSVVVDGKPYGNTPIGPISLAPGTHTVSVTNSDLGAQRSATVKILPGKPNAVKFDLKKD